MRPITISEVIETYIVIYDFTNCVSFMSPDVQGEDLNLFWRGDNPVDIYVDPEQLVVSDGDTFTITDTDGHLWQFRAVQTVRLNDLNEPR
jgi:hypothetical protein